MRATYHTRTTSSPSSSVVTDYFFLCLDTSPKLIIAVDNESRQANEKPTFQKRKSTQKQNKGREAKKSHTYNTYDRSVQK